MRYALLYKGSEYHCEVYISIIIISPVSLAGYIKSLYLEVVHPIIPTPVFTKLGNQTWSTSPSF